MRFIEVCSGCGGLSQGLMNAGWEPILINEIDKTCCATLRENHPDNLYFHIYERLSLVSLFYFYDFHL